MNADNSTAGGRLLATLLLLAAVCMAAVYFSSGAATLSSDETLASLDISARLENGFGILASDTASEVFSLPKIYHLPVDDSPASPAIEECYRKETIDGVDYDIYEDQSITVKVWRERWRGTTINLAEITISSPTQLRSGFAGGSYSATVRDTPLNIARSCNAIVAVNADFANYRTSGLVLRQGKLYRAADSAWDTLLIDSVGDMHTARCRSVINDGTLDDMDIWNAFTFGPATISGGQISITNGLPLPTHGTPEPRTSIGQLGELHYLLATCDGRAENSPGLTVYGMAEVMLEHGCQTAYNLDGGHSTTMVFHNKVYNHVAYGGQRTMSDIIYFGSSVPAD